MFIRLNSDYFAKKTLATENEYTVCQDKSGVQIKCAVDSADNLVAGPIAVQTHACFVVRNPELGLRSPAIVTPDTGDYVLDTKLTKKQAETAAGLDWHFRVHFMRIDTPYFPQ